VNGGSHLPGIFWNGRVGFLDAVFLLIITNLNEINPPILPLQPLSALRPTLRRRVKTNPDCLEFLSALPTHKQFGNLHIDPLLPGTDHDLRGRGSRLPMILMSAAKHAHGSR
jgi:hypothetical protein